MWLMVMARWYHSISSGLALDGGGCWRAPSDVTLSSDSRSTGLQRGGGGLAPDGDQVDRADPRGLEEVDLELAAGRRVVREVVDPRHALGAAALGDQDYIAETRRISLTSQSICHSNAKTSLPLT